MKVFVPAVVVLVVALVAISPAAPADGRREIEPGATTGTARAVVVGDVPLVHTAQLLPSGGGSAEDQCAGLLADLGEALTAAGSGLDQVVKLNLYASSDDDALAAARAVARRFRTRPKPALSVVVTRLPADGARVALDAVATTQRPPEKGVRLTVPPLRVAGGAPVSTIPAGGRVYVSGQAVPAASPGEATRLTLRGLCDTLGYVGMSDCHIAQIKVFLSPATAAEEVRTAVTEFFGARPAPPVVLVEWEAALPVEIEVIAGGVPARAVAPVAYVALPGQRPSPVFSRVVRVGPTPTVYLSGLYGDGADSADEARALFAELERVLKPAGSDLRHLVKATYYHSTADAGRALDDIRPKLYDRRRPPAASKARVAGVGRPGRTLTLDMIAVPAAGR